MGGIGLINKVLSLLSTYDIKYSIAKATHANADSEKTLERLSVAVANAGKSKNLSDILNIERMILYSELSRCADALIDKGRITSLTNAVDDLNKASDGLTLVLDEQKYKESCEIVSSHNIDRKNGIPRDKVHRFIDSHITRLNNSLIFSSASFEEKSLTKERLSNMKILKNEYMNLQAKALNILLSEKR